MSPPDPAADASRIRLSRRCLPAVVVLFLLIAVPALQNGQASGPAGAADAPAPPASYDRDHARRRAAELAALGQTLFMDPRLSASGRQACASCHSPAHHFGPPNDLAVQPGGANMTQAGVRAVPSLMYLQDVPPFDEHFVDSEEEGDNSTDNGPTGGLTWDGRVNRADAQARIPLLDPREMGNADAAAVVARVRAAPYADTVRRLYGGQVFDDVDRAFDAIVQALAYYQDTPALFFPYSSKFDAVMQGRARFSEQEARGLRLFSAEDKGNCASCHRFGVPGTLPVFNDYGLIGLGVPRNPDIPANADPQYFDLGLCGPYRKDLSGHAEDCGLFRSPTLRNVATRQTFFHNGVFHTLRQVVDFYATRDVEPERWYPRGKDGGVESFDDVPAQYRGNINMDPPFGGKPGGVPPLSPREIDDIVAFLGTLTDGYFDPSSAPAHAQR
ncbi:cytochrome-c peroxidase [Bordetella flabilis]|uniref:cytochrome-c peroxidase n=1 Tax=Bordetella flabilis TaxID=463014 RepID=UPI0009FEB969|nr:cytochrome c peroxidase [Bordetella flabilis]